MDHVGRIENRRERALSAEGDVARGVGAKCLSICFFRQRADCIGEKAGAKCLFNPFFLEAGRL